MRFDVLAAFMIAAPSLGIGSSRQRVTAHGRDRVSLGVAAS